MSSLAKHAWGLQYLHMKLFAILMRSITMPFQWLGNRMHNLLDGAVCRRIFVPSRDDGRFIEVKLHEATGYDSTKPTPVLVNIHGSGFILPSLGSDSNFCEHVATRTRCVVFDIDYRKAPEHPFPAALQDIEDVLAYLGAHPDRFDASNIFLSGFSAGGCLALSTSASLGPNRIKGVVAIYAPLDFTTRHAAPEKSYLSGMALPGWLCDRFDVSYVLPGQPRDDPRLSPIFAPWNRFPKHVYAACGDGDILYQSNVEWMQKLKDAGHQDATFEKIEREGHGFDKFAKEGSESAAKRDNMYAAAIDMINRVVNTDYN
ncbi:alpha/beta-hydrolase [Athelia psychrophila]|uniref:Alpha/beta-hydrolase n=1 Tax=Athelia psychrophila TaxID=1759441 RepID=A0A166Q9C9_9AGAM|nr:alpha/beta-hydrolase [Fibularhizoctonia sp. CBS 109695]